MLDLSAINGILVEEANRMDEEILQNGLHVSPWVDLIEYDTFPEGMGEAISTVIWEPSRYTTLTWNKVSAVDDTGKTIIPAASTISTAKSDVEWYLEHVALESDLMNLNDLRTAARAEDQLAAIYQNLSFNTHRLMEERNRSEYTRVSTTKVVADSLTAATEGTTTMPAVTATLELSNAFLAKYRMRILRNGGAKYAYDKVDNAPVFALVCDSEVSRALKNELGENLRFAARANELLTPYGCDGVYENFYHIIDDLAARFTWSGSAWVEVTPEADASAGAGTKRIPRTAYETAPFTDSIILVKNVMKIAVPNTKVGRQSSGVSFDPCNYRGDWKWLNVINVDKNSDNYNPDGAIGFFRGVIAEATKPRLTQLGCIVRHYRPGFAP